MKLLKIINKLPRRDWLRFQSLLSATSFNQRTDVKLLLSVIIAEKGRSYPSRFYWKKAFPDKTFSLKDFNLVTSRLFKLLEDYLIQEEMKKEESLKKFYLAKAYRRLQEEKQFKGAVKSTVKALSKESFQNMNYLQLQHDLSFQQFDYILSFNRKEKTNLQEVNTRCLLCSGQTSVCLLWSFPGSSYTGEIRDWIIRRSTRSGQFKT